MVNIEYFKELPFREGMKRPYGWDACSNFDSWHSTSGIPVWKRVKRILNDNVGKSFDMAFHYYCKHVPKYQQEIFLREFSTFPECWRIYHPGYYIDDNGDIQKVYKQHKRLIKIYSDDYRVAYKPKKYYHQQWKNKERSEIPWYESKNDYEKIIYGTVQEFESRRHPTVIKYRRNEHRKNKLKERQRKAENKARSLEIFNRSIQLQKNRLGNSVNLIF